LYDILLKNYRLNKEVSEMDVFEKVKEITAEQLHIDESIITMDASFINAVVDVLFTKLY
jgi:hypothetical protein